jgi:ABC-type glycerol-3-phosphate transport system substrate-binding protein
VTPELSEEDQLPRSTASPAAGNRNTIPTPTAAPESQLGVEASDLQGTTVEYWHAWSDEAGQLTEALISEFNETNPWGIKAEATYIGNFNALSEQVLSTMPEGDTPDLVAAFNHQALAWDAQDEITVDLNAYISDPVWGWSEAEQADFYPVFWQQGILGEKHLSIPAQSSGQMLYYNSTWAQELGFRSPPTTTSQFRAQACAAARANQQDEDSGNDGTGGWIISTDYSAVLGWLYSFDSQITRPDGNGYRFNSPEVEEALGYLRELYEQGCAWLPEDRSPEEAFAQRQGLFSTGSIMGIPTQQGAITQAGSADEWTAIPFPAPDGSQVITVYGPSMLILESTPEKQLASWLLTQWLLSPENQARWVQATVSYPLRESALELVDASAIAVPQWSTAVNLLKDAQPEPNLGSWDNVRWALSDVATQLFRWYFTLDQLPDTVKLLDRTASELHNRSP